MRIYADDNSNGLEGEDLKRFNRLLLEEAYPAACGGSRGPSGRDLGQRYAKPTAALCLSGGGICSGTFSLGVLQGLARRGLSSSFTTSRRCRAGATSGVGSQPGVTATPGG